MKRLEDIEGYDEGVAVRLLQIVGETVRRLTQGGKLPIDGEVELHEEIVTAHRTQDWGGYIRALRRWLLGAFDVWIRHRRGL